ncbi:unnamed protein product [Moneuplotes crassus]|uniref:Uncharacterized protein n=1 Tax=Euplotes crassus TaxID=5936 RepID=A0AAD1XTU6_EUPCR|nr:unnamed protein product [Moneuplotes crassus]
MVKCQIFLQSSARGGRPKHTRENSPYNNYTIDQSTGKLSKGVFKVPDLSRDRVKNLLKQKQCRSSLSYNSMTESCSFQKYDCFRESQCSRKICTFKSVHNLSNSKSKHLKARNSLSQKKLTRTLNQNPFQNEILKKVMLAQSPLTKEMVLL